jgi:hypothetical protein
MNRVTSVGLGCADPLAGIRLLFALLRRRFAPASLRSEPLLKIHLVVVTGRDNHLHPLGE